MTDHYCWQLVIPLFILSWMVSTLPVNTHFDINGHLHALTIEENFHLLYRLAALSYHCLYYSIVICIDSFC